MAWSDYIPKGNAKLLEAQYGMEVLIKAINEKFKIFAHTRYPDREKVFEIGKLGLIDYATYQSWVWGSNSIYSTKGTVMENIDRFINALARMFTKPFLLNDISQIQIDENVDAWERYSYSTSETNNWSSIDEIIEHLGEEKIEWFTPLNKKFPAAWFEQRIRILNLMTVVLISNSYNYGNYFQGYLISNSETKYRMLSLHSTTVPGGTTPDGMMDMLMEDADSIVARTSSGGTITNYSQKGYGDCGEGGNHTVPRALIYSSRVKFSFTATSYLNDFNYNVSICGTPNQASIYRKDGNTFNSGNPNWQEGVNCLLGEIEVNGGTSEPTGWIGDFDFFPQPVSTPPPIIPQTRYENTTGFAMLVYGFVDFAVPGGFEFIEET